MIIKFPTGLYESILPGEGDSGNVTYTISTQAPPRPEVRIIQLPVAEQLRPLPEGYYTEDQRRAALGELVFTIVKSSRSLAGSNAKQFEIGETLVFDDEIDQAEVLQVVRVPETVEIRHNTNLLDLGSIGLTDEEIAALTQESEARKRVLEKELSDTRMEIENLKVQITEAQKKINESIKAISAVREIYGIPENDETFNNAIYQKLLATKKDLEITRDNLIVTHNTKGVEAEETYKAIQRISELVR
jgi:hypothetical protein